MKALLAAAALAAVLATPAAAISRYNVDSMSCSQAQQTVRSDGAAILRYSSKRTPGLTLYGRYVRNDLFCSGHEIAERVWIPTADRKSCPVLECKPADDEFDDLLRRRF
ncbi:MAG: hypothetical protein KF723_05225 [Rhizobiaceae bacterium]|nr:hypothetical protein [Rhizobiaceae bacterium]